METLSAFTSKIKKIKAPKQLNKILENKAVLYFVLFLAVINLLGYLMVGNIRAILVYIVIAYLTYHVSKNMIVVLTIPLILTSILLAGKVIKEGLENMNNDDNEKDNKKDSKKDGKKDDKKDDKKEDNKEEKNDKKENQDDGKKAPAPVEHKKDSAEKFTGYAKTNNRIDYAATVEDAYDDLNKILGEGGIKSLTDDTKKLMDQQMQLADAMKNMAPLMDQAKSMMQGFDLKNMGDMGSLMQKFNSNDGE